MDKQKDNQDVEPSGKTERKKGEKERKKGNKRKQGQSP